MKRLIDADDLKDWSETVSLTDDGGIDINDFEEKLKSMPIIYAEPVRRGKWIYGSTLGHSWMKCSECCVSQNGQTLCFSYCPNCGARMDEE